MLIFAQKTNFDPLEKKLQNRSNANHLYNVV